MRLSDHRDKMFIVDRQGRHVFYPFGRLGRGRILDNEEHARGLRLRITWMSRAYLGALALAAVAFIALHIIETKHVLMLVFGGYGFFLLLLFLFARRYPVSDEKLHRVRRKKSWASRYIGTPFWWLCLVFFALLDVALGTGLLLAHASGVERFEYTPSAVIALLFLAIAPFYCGWKLYSRRATREEEDVDPDVFS